jgi:hypothetical protein
MITKKKEFWVTLSLAQLCITALLGFFLRTKILFPLPGIEFKNILHAHSHFAFGGWMTLILMTLMIYEILPDHLRGQRIYSWVLAGIFLNSWGMLVTFLWQGYALFSILFSTLFILVTYFFSYIYIRDILKSKAGKTVTLLGISSVICLVLSSIGPFTLAWMTLHYGNFTIYRDAIYTYLHFQYNGFFSLSVFAVFFHAMNGKMKLFLQNRTWLFARILTISVIPTLFISYLWHSENIMIRSIAVMGCMLNIFLVFSLFFTLYQMKDLFAALPAFTKRVAWLSIIAFFIKCILQTGTIFPELGKLVYGDRAIIVGYLHLVLLGFLTIYLLAHLLQSGMLYSGSKFTRMAIITFVTGVIANETILMVQGFGNMLLVSNSLYATVLWGISIWLFSGTILVLISRIRVHEQIFNQLPHNSTEAVIYNT